MLAPTRRQLLRNATATAHVRLERSVGALGDIDDYARYLLSSLAFRGPLETALSTLDWPKAFGDWRPTTIVPLLARDLADLGREPPPPQPRCPNLSFDEARLLGTLYVLEGSSLGARLLYRHVARLGLDENKGAAHLAKQSTSQTWRAFLPLLERAPDALMPSIIAAAKNTFDAARERYL